MNLITGATGLLGSHLAYDLIKKGEDVRILVRNHASLEKLKRTFSFYDDQAETLFSKLDIVDGDVLDVWSVKEAMEGVTRVYHCAAVVSFNPITRGIMRQVNAEGTANMVNMSVEHEVEKFCYVSSIAALGRSESNGEYVTELTEWKPSSDNSQYAISKYHGEKEVWRGMAEGLDACIVNPSVIIGPGDWREGSASMFTKVYEGLKYYTSGVNGFVDVRDVSKVMVDLVERGVTGDRFIVSSENCPYREVFNWIAEVMGKNKASVQAGRLISEFAWRTEKIRSSVTGGSPLITKETARMANRQYHYSNMKIKEALGMEFIPVKQSVEDTARIFMESVGARPVPA